ncbi:MAG: sulfite exporter TauE/SafE family protein [Tepidanaerobacteraceae bacterium]|nr:sulfite exporter TauE/SafE family protein [Tepidanaerobacteraceae bacterium]
MFEININSILFTTAVNFLAAFLQASVGFGYAILAMSLMPFVLPMRVCSAISAITVVVIGLQMVIMLRKHLDWRIILVPVISCMFTTNIGIYILMHYPERILRNILAAFILLLTAYFFISQKYKMVIKKSLINDILFGMVTGISTGMFNIVGPFFMIYYFSICDDNMSFKASMESTFLVAGLYSTILHILYRNITLEIAPLLLSSAIAAMVAGFIGLRLFRQLNRDMIVMVIYFALPLMAFLLLKS